MALVNSMCLDPVFPHDVIVLTEPVLDPAAVDFKKTEGFSATMQISVYSKANDCRRTIVTTLVGPLSPDSAARMTTVVGAPHVVHPPSAFSSPVS